MHSKTATFFQVSEILICPKPSVGYCFLIDGRLVNMYKVNSTPGGSSYSPSCNSEKTWYNINFPKLFYLNLTRFGVMHRALQHYNNKNNNNNNNNNMGRLILGAIILLIPLKSMKHSIEKVAVYKVTGFRIRSWSMIIAIFAMSLFFSNQL